MIKILSEEARIILMQFYSICDGNQLRKSSKSITRICLKLIWKYERWPWQYCKAARYLIMKAESGKIATWWLLSAAQISRRIEIKITFSTFNCFPSKLKWGRGRVTHTRLELPTNTREVSHLPVPTSASTINKVLLWALWNLREHSLTALEHTRPHPRLDWHNTFYWWIDNHHLMIASHEE